MNSEEIRSLNHDCQKEINETQTEKEQQFGVDSVKLSLLAEVAAQLAELNDKLKVVLNPPLMYDTSNIGPNERIGFSYDLPQPIFMAMEPRATLRDQFAMAAMMSDSIQSAIVSASYMAQGKTYAEEFPGLETGVEAYYKTADAMMKARLVRNSKVDTAQ